MVPEQPAASFPASAGAVPVSNFVSAADTSTAGNTEFTLITDTSSSTAQPSSTPLQFPPFSAQSQPPPVTAAYSFSSWTGGNFPESSSYLNYGPSFSTAGNNSTMSSTFIPLSSRPPQFPQIDPQIQPASNFPPPPTSLVRSAGIGGNFQRPPPAQPSFPPPLSSWNHSLSSAPPQPSFSPRIIPTNISINIKLTSQNYRSWKMNIIAILRSHRLFDHILYTGAPPNRFVPLVSNPSSDFDYTPNNRYLDWEYTEDSVRAILLNSITEEVFPLITNLNRSSEIWTALERTFGLVSGTRQFQLGLDLYGLQKNDLSMTAYMQKLKTILDDLAASGNPFPAHLLPPLLFKNLGEDYHNVIQSIITRCGTAIDYYELFDRLVAYETLLQSTRPTPMANYSTKHVDNNPRPVKKRGHCYICGDKAHWANKCPNRNKKGRYFEQGQSSQSRPQAHIAYQPHDPFGGAVQPWYPDTGATHHMTANATNLQNVQPYPVHDSVQFGNGQGNQGNPLARME